MRKILLLFAAACAGQKWNLPGAAPDLRTGSPFSPHQTMSGKNSRVQNPAALIHYFSMDFSQQS